MMKKTLVLGASSKPNRYSNLAIRRLVETGEEVVALGMKKGYAYGIPIDNGLVEYEDIDTVSLYLSPKNQPAYYDYVVSLKPKRVIFNPGTENPEFSTILKERGIEAEDSCTLVLLATDQY